MTQSIDLTPIVQAIITLLAVVLTSVVVPWLKAKLNAEQQATMRALVKTLVYAAEQIYGSGNGQSKKRYVENKLKLAGYDVNTDEIEAAVAQAFNLVATTTLEVATEGENE